MLARKRFRSLAAVTAALVLGAGGTLTAAAPASAASSVIEDFEASTSAPASFYVYNGGGSGAGMGVETVAAGDALARYGQTGSNNILSVGISQVSGGWSGFGHNLPAVGDWSAYAGLQMWVHGTDSGATFRMELLDTAREGSTSGTAERWDFSLVDDFTGWQLVQMPFASFTYATGYQPDPGNQTLDLDKIAGFVLPFDSGSVTLKFDDFATYSAVATVEDFQASASAPAAFYTYNGGGSGAGMGVETVAAGDALARPMQTAANNILSVGFSQVSGGWCGFGMNLSAVADWSGFTGLQFWMHGTNSGGTFRMELLDTARTGSDAGTAERWDFSLADDFTGWRLVQLPFASFTYATAYQPDPGNQSLDLDKIAGFVVPFDSGTGTLKFDDFATYGGGSVPVVVGATTASSSVTEGASATVQVKLNVASTDPVTVEWTTADGTATDAGDYTAASGTITFPAGDVSESVAVATTDDSDVEGNESFTVALSSPSGATLGTATHTVTIRDNDAAAVTGTWDNKVLDDDFEYASGTLPAGKDADGNNVGFELFRDPAATTSVSATLTDDAPSAVPGAAADNTYLAATIKAASYAGFTHKFTDDAATAWQSKDWSRYDGVSFWLYGHNTGQTLFVDILDDRNTGSTTDDAGRYSINFADDKLGWRYVQIAFKDLVRKDIGNGAPNNGFTPSKITGWAFGAAPAPIEATYYIDDFSVTVPETVVDAFEDGAPSYPGGQGFHTYQGNGSFAVTTVADEPYAGVAAGNDVLQMTADVADYGGVSRGFVNETEDGWASQDWTDAQGVNFWFKGTNSGARLNVDLFDDRTDKTTDTSERWTASFTDDTTGWRFVQLAWDDFTRGGYQPPGAPDNGLTLREVYGYAIGTGNTSGSQVWAVDRVALWGYSLANLPVLVGFDRNTYAVPEGSATDVTVTLSRPSASTVTVGYGAPDRGAIPAATTRVDVSIPWGTLTFAPGETSKSFTITTTEDGKHEVDEYRNLALRTVTGGALLHTTLRHATLRIDDDDATDPELVDDFEYGTGMWSSKGNKVAPLTVTPTTGGYPGAAAYERVLTATVDRGAPLVREFAEPQDFSDGKSVSVWYKGTGSGRPVTVGLRDDAKPDPGPAGWTRTAFRDNFSSPAGTSPDSSAWTHETGGGGWGNAEEQYYTKSPANSSTDGNGNLAVNVRSNTSESLWCDANGEQCGYTSARLITEGKKEFRYGRIEARIKVPAGEGLWPAFWTLGSDFREVGWPQSGEIDVMEHVEGDHGKPEEVFGTVHGPGYAGGQSIGGKTTTPGGVPLSDDFHVFTVDWQADQIDWYMDGTKYYSLTKADLEARGKEWVFDHPFFVLLNVAIGGNFGGTIDQSLTFPKTMLVDYVRVMQAPDTAERFGSTFYDTTAGWKRVVLPFSSFKRGTWQPAGAPDNGLTLTSVHGLTLSVGADDQRIALDAVRVTDEVPPTRVTKVTGTPTSSAIFASRTFAPGAPVAIISNTHDAVAMEVAAPAAAKLRGPLLLTGAETLSSALRRELTRLRPKRILIVGDPGAVSTAVQRELTAYATSGVVSRVNGRRSREETFTRLTRPAFQAPGVPVVYIVPSLPRLDAAAASAAAVRRGGVVLPVSSRGVSEVIAAELTRLAPKSIVIVGSATDIPAAVRSQLRAYAPSVSSAGGDSSPTRAAVVSRSAFTDAGAMHVAAPGAQHTSLVGAAVLGQPVLVTGSATVPSIVRAEIIRLSPTSMRVHGTATAPTASVMTLLSRLLS